jgi:hypothetical protein
MLSIRGYDFGLGEVSMPEMASRNPLTLLALSGSL